MSAERHKTRSLEKRGKAVPLTDLISLPAIINRVRCVVDRTRNRASKLFMHDEPIIVKIKYSYSTLDLPDQEERKDSTYRREKNEEKLKDEKKQEKGGKRENNDEKVKEKKKEEEEEEKNRITKLIFIHSEYPPEYAERVEFEFDLKKLAAILLRDALEISGLTENRGNIRKALDWITGLLYNKTRISGEQKGLSTANMKGFENVLNDPNAAYDPLLRRGLAQIFELEYVISEIKHAKSTHGDLQNSEGGLDTLELEKRITDVLTARQQQNPGNAIYSYIYNNNNRVTVQHDGKKKTVPIVELIKRYLLVSRKVLFEVGEQVTYQYDVAQINDALDQIIGNLKLEEGEKLSRESIESIRGNIRGSINPILLGALHEIVKKPRPIKEIKKKRTKKKMI